MILFGSLVTSSPICSINQELNKDTATKLQDFRHQTLKTCMQCNGNSCKLKEWSKDKKGDEYMQALFCTPSYVSKFFEKPANVKSGRTKSISHIPLIQKVRLRTLVSFPLKEQ